MSGDAAAAASAPGAGAHPLRRDLAELGRLAGPVVVSRLGIMTMGLTDTIVVGRFSADQLGYQALAWAMSSALMGSSLGLLSGVQVMASRATGEGDLASAGAALRRGLVYAVWIGLATGVAIALVGPPLVGALGLKGGLARGATPPMLIFAVSMPSFALSAATASWLEGLGRMTPPMLLMWIANAINLAIDLVLVPGALGAPALGAVGAATATLTARTFLALATGLYIVRMKDARALGVFEKPAPSRAKALEQRRIGYGAAASNFFEMTAFSAMNIIAGWLSPIAVAAWAVVLNVAALVFMVPLGLSTATAVMVGRAYGAMDFPALRRAAGLGFAATAAFGIVIGLAVWPNARALAFLYTSDATAARLAATGLALSALFYLPDAMQVVTAQALRARGDVVVPTFTHLTSYAVIMVPLAYWFAIPAGRGLAGIVYAVIVASFVSAGLLLARFWWLARRD